MCIALHASDKGVCKRPFCGVVGEPCGVTCHSVALCRHISGVEFDSSQERERGRE